MKESTSKEKVLKKIRDALVDRMAVPYQHVDMESPVYTEHGNDFLEETFAKALLKAGGQFVYCASLEDLTAALHTLLKETSINKIFCSEDFLTGLVNKEAFEITNNWKDVFSCDVALTACEVLVARLGTIVCSSAHLGGRQSMVAAPMHVVIATNKQVVYGLDEAISNLKERHKTNMPSLVSFITGPSRTADIEKTMVHGAHGPKDLYLFMLDMNEMNE